MSIKLKWQHFALLTLLSPFSVPSFSATAFTSCPTQAFLFQDSIVRAYDVNLFTGEFGLLETDMGTGGKFNGVGFSVHDDFVYGWSYVHNTVGKVGSEYQIEAVSGVNFHSSVLNSVGSPITFYVGDVAVSTNEYFVYRKGSGYGLYAIPLDSGAGDYLQMRRIANSENMNLNIFDIAFHPSDGYAYTVDRNGILYRIDVVNGTATNLGNTGQSGTYGAVYFDVSGNLYFSRNQDGIIFRVTIGSSDYTAVEFARGPSSGQNDGARCATAPVTSVAADLDFGDAPKSYGTLAADNGARHLQTGNSLYLGDAVDQESDGRVYPLEDVDDNGVTNDDGVKMLTALSVDSQALLQVNASASGKLSVWIDHDADGSFNNITEKVVSDRAVSSGSNFVLLSLPATAKEGQTWARFRVSSDSALQPTGSASDGEVEDYLVNIIEKGGGVTTYPSGNNWSTVAFEDNWPLEGDYDMNDLVMYLRTEVFKDGSGQATAVKISGELAAVGAAYHNGFGIRLPGILSSNINTTDLKFVINDNEQGSPLEAGRTEAIFIMAYNTFTYADAGEDSEICNFYRTELGCGSSVQMNFELTVPFNTPVNTNLIGVFDPFLFATPGAWHGNVFGTNYPGRSYEIHLKNYAPTEAFDTAFFDLNGSFTVNGVSIPINDKSDPASSLYYLNENGLPWAIEVSSRWEYPREYIDVLKAYPDFYEFVTSEGVNSLDWFVKSNQVNDYIYYDTAAN